MKEIVLANGKGVTRVSDSDFEWLSQYKWYLTNKGYAAAKIDGKQTRMHRLVIGAKEDEIVDHINMEKLDNTIDNLRLANKSQNNAHRVMKLSQYGYRGVEKHRSKWRASIEYQNKRYRFGNFNSPQEAAIKYNEMASEIYGGFAILNEV